MGDGGVISFGAKDQCAPVTLLHIKLFRVFFCVEGKKKGEDICLD